MASALKVQCKQFFMPNLWLHRYFNNPDLKKKLCLEQIFAYKHEEIVRKYRNPLRRNVYKYILQLQSNAIILISYHIIREENPDFIILWNGKKFHQAIVAEVAKVLEKRVVYFENGLLPDTTQMDFQGVNFSNSVPRDRRFYENLYFDSRCQLPEKLFPRKSVYRYIHTTDSLPEKYIFVPFQVVYDTQIIQHSPWISDMYDLYHILEEVSQKLKIFFVIKQHPSDRVASYDDLSAKSRFILFSDEPTQTLIEKAEAVVTINSTVGIEALLFHKKVIVLGEAFYSINGIVKQANDIGVFIDILSKLDLWHVETKLIEKFLKYLYCRYLIPKSWKEPDENHFKKIEKRLKKAMKRV